MLDMVDERWRRMINRRWREVRHIFAINRSTGSVVEYFDNGWSSLFESGYTCLFLPEDAIIQEGWQRTLRSDMLHHPSEGILSTGLPYVFIGEFDFLKYREIYGFFWERAVDGSAIANSPTEAANLGQFYLSPDFRMNSIVRNIIVLYCPQTDNWVVQWNFLQDRIRRPPVHIFAINRSTGSVVEYFDNMSSVYRPDSELRRIGWQRTLGVSTDPEEGFWQRIADSVVDFFQRFTR